MTQFNYILQDLTPPLTGVLLADTHGFLDERIAAQVEAADFAVHAGDIGSGEVLDRLRPRHRLVAVRGNNDPPADSTGREPLVGLAERAELALPGGVLAVVHGDAWPARNRHRRLRAEFPEARAVLYGHSHRLKIDNAALPWILNPGAAGRTRVYEGPSCLLLHIDDTARWRVEVLRFQRKRNSGRGVKEGGQVL